MKGIYGSLEIRVLLVLSQYHLVRVFTMVGMSCLKWSMASLKDLTSGCSYEMDADEDSSSSFASLMLTLRTSTFC